METTKINITPANRITNMPKYIFAELADLKQQAIANGVDVIDISIGNPDGATPDPVVKVALEAIQNPINHGYPNFRGKPELRKAISDWMKKRYYVDVDPDKEVQTLIGEKEGLANMIKALVNPNENEKDQDVILIPTPGYASYSQMIKASNARSYGVELKKEDDYQPDMNKVLEKYIKEELAINNRIEDVYKILSQYNKLQLRKVSNVDKYMYNKLPIEIRFVLTDDAAKYVMRNKEYWKKRKNGESNILENYMLDKGYKVEYKNNNRIEFWK